MILQKNSFRLIVIALLVLSGNSSYCQQDNTMAIDTNINSMNATTDTVVVPVKKMMTGAEQVKSYLTLLRGKRVGLVVNHTSMINQTHLVDSLLKLKIKVELIFSPEHGFRGSAPAGEKVGTTIDEKSGIKVISLYGTHLKPTKKEMEQIDVMLFDIQDVGARFYTYISTLHNVLEACAENDKLLVVLDRPNPNDFYIDGPRLNMKLKSFVGMNPIPIVHAMTVGELAQMINMEEWIKSAPCRLRVIKMKNYAHGQLYKLPVWPSPNITDMKAVYLYPSLCWFEGTRVSVARGTDKPFQQIGYPGFSGGDISFKPASMSTAPNPMYKDTVCGGWDLSRFVSDSTTLPKQLNLSWLIKMYQSYPDKTKFFNPFFDKLAGTAKLREQIVKGTSEEEIRAGWQEELTDFKQRRKKYLLYDDFDEIKKKSAHK